MKPKYMNRNVNKKKPSSKVLNDHKKIGKKFIPPIVQAIGGTMHFVSYFKETLPELLWLALIERSEGLLVAAKISQEIGHFVRDCCEKSQQFGSLSQFAQISPERRLELCAYLDTAGLLYPLRCAVHDLVVLYPDCPIKFIFDKVPTQLCNGLFLVELEKLVEVLCDKRGRNAVLMQANLVYMVGCQGKLFFKKGLLLGNLEELENYPDTEESLKVGASVCTTCQMLINIQNNEKKVPSWPNYFWKRNLELKPINLAHLKERQYA